jgi:hypothetical protein
MKITKITVEGVGKFGTRSEIVGLGSGVNILAAGNEAGKSTLFRAVHACLFERHNTKNEIVRNLATDGVSLPITVTLGFEHEDQAYTVTKSFIKSPAASLIRGSTEIARGREADEMVWELLGIAPGGGRSVDEAAFGILWVGQGQSLHVPEPSEAATTVLNTAIQAEVGTLVGGERARTVLSALKEEIARLVTDTGRPKAGGVLAESTVRLDTLQSDLADVEVRLSVLDGQLVELAAKRSERARLSDPALVGEMKSDFESARQDLKAGEGSAALLSQFEATEQRSKVVLDRGERHLIDLRDCGARIDTDRKREAELREAAAPLDRQEEAARETIRLARDEITTLDAKAEREEGQERDLQRIATAVSRAAARATLARQLQGLEALRERLVKNTASLANNRATASVMTSLDEAERELSLLTARLEAVAPEVTIELGATGAGRVSIADRLLATNVVQAVIDPLRICVGDLATITVSPRAAANTADRKKRQDSQKRLSKLIEDAGGASVGELRATRTRRQALEAEAAGLQAEIAALDIPDKAPALAIERIRIEVEEIDVLVKEALTQTKIDALPTAEDIEIRQDSLRQNREEARRKRQTLDGTIEAQNSILSNLADVRGRLTGTLTEISKRLDGDLAILPDADRARLIADAEAAFASARDDHRTKAAALEEQRQKAPPLEELERRRIRVDRLQSALESQKIRLGSLDKEVANLEGQIQNAGGDGLGEKVEAFRQERDLTYREVEKHKARVGTLLLLKETIEACYKEQRDRLHAPLRRHLQPFLNDVFPSAELELGDHFAVAGIKRGGPIAENFERLSAGTQEQIAVLVRLAMGAMLCERSHPVPIILDDALVYSDDDRIGQMFDALNRAGQNQQVIVLTCRVRAFAALGGRQLSISSNVTDPNSV